MTRSGPARQRHLVDVWNPSYASDAMTAHLTVLLEAAQRTKGTEDVSYVWWGKVRSSNRRQELRNLPQVLEIAQELERDEDRECHLYLTDYRSLYVGLVDAIIPEDVRGTDGVHVPGYYTANSLECDFWYRLLDIRRLVGDDTPVVIEKLKALRNLNYGERPVSIYGGMVDLPLVVYRQDDDRLFDPEVRGAVTEDRLWAELDAEAVGVGTIERELRENLFGDAAWLALDPAARTFIASAEKILRDQRSDPAFDYGPIVANLAKALEVTCNAILRRVGRSLPREVRQIKIEQETIDLGAGKHLSTGQLANGEVADVRNPGVHRVRIGREAAMRLRNTLVGVGCQGAFIELAKVSPR